MKKSIFHVRPAGGSLSRLEMQGRQGGGYKTEKIDEIRLCVITACPLSKASHKRPRSQRYIHVRI